ncbi:MAG: hypothetical protein IJC56_10395 [Clostridia bacterium]|nr:hypothetical protein [Clostridia bacterium]
MTRKLAIFLMLVLVVGILGGCAGTTVVYQTNCDCPEEAVAQTPANEEPIASAEGAVKTGLAIVASASGETASAIEYDASIVAVTVDDAGVIASCIIDSLGATVSIDATGAITSDTAAALATKNELGDNYGMKAYAGAKYEWYEQAAALADYAVGKTVDELKNGAIDESGKAPAGSDLATTATIYLGGYVSAIEAAVNNAAHLGAQHGDELRYAVIASLSDSASATADAAGLAQLNLDAVALTVKDGVITSCALDSLQGKVNFDAAGVITTDLTAPMQTKNQLGEAYGMKAYAGAKYEWNEQAANFAAYVTGKTAADVAGIAVSEGKPSDADLSASVTIAIGGFQGLIEKAMQ